MSVVSDQLSEREALGAESANPIHAESPKSQAALSTRGLAKSYGGVHALLGADLDIHRGLLVSILGPSGSGKTTLLQCIAGFVRPDAGRIVVGGRDVTWAPPHKRNLGMVFQSHALFGHMTVLNNVAFGLKMRRVKRTRAYELAQEALKLVRLQGFEDRYPRQLSGGQQQRVALARALVISPAALLLDEPLSSLDRSLRDELRSEIRRVQLSLSTPTLFVTHDQEEALAISDRVVVMREGQIEQVGAPADLYDAPRTRFVAQFLGSSNVLVGQVSGDGGRAIFEWRGVRLPAPLPEGLGSGLQSEAAVVVKPDALSFRDAKRDIPDGMAVMEGVMVESVEFLGQASLVTFEAQGIQMKARIGRGDGQVLPSPGTRVCACWDPSSSHVIIDSSDSAVEPAGRGRD